MLRQLLEWPKSIKLEAFMAKVMFVGGTEGQARQVWAESGCEADGDQFISFEPFEEIKYAVAAIVETAPDVVVVEFNLSHDVTSPELMYALRKHHVWDGVFIMKSHNAFNLRESLSRSKQAREDNQRRLSYQPRNYSGW